MIRKSLSAVSKWAGPFINSVTSNTISGVIAGLLLTIPLVYYWNSFCGFVIGLFGWLFESVEVTRVWYFLLILLVLAVAALILMHLYALWFSEKEPTWHDYTEEQFDNILWCWRYVAGTIQNLDAFCPHCKHRLLLEDVGYGSLEFRCVHHGRIAVADTYDLNEIRKPILILIEGRITSGEWRSVLESQGKL